MADYVESLTKDGKKILIEVDTDGKGSAGFGRQSGTDGPTAGGADAYQQSLDTIRTCAADLIDTLQTLETPPKAASFDFGIKVDPKAGAMIAKSMGEGQFKVSLSWRQDEPETDKKDDA